MYWCSCNSERAELVDSICAFTDVSFSEFEKQLIPCIHIMAMKAILVEIDATHDVLPSVEFHGNYISAERTCTCTVYIYTALCLIMQITLIQWWRESLKRYII